MLFCGAVALLGIIDPSIVAGSADAVTGAAFRALDWLFIGAVTGFLLLAMWLAFGRYGRVKLGQPDDEPEFSNTSWLAMLFAAGMGVGLLFWGVAEPMMHWLDPPLGEGGTSEAARHAFLLTNFHWGLHAWSVYAIAALVLAYFGFRRRTPYLAGAPLRSVFRGRWVGPVAALADFIAVVAISFGVAGSIGMGGLQLQQGLAAVSDISADSSTVSMVILVVLFVCYMTSAATSLDKGIRILSNLNVGIALGLLLFILAAGPTSDLLRTVLTSAGAYVTGVVGLSLHLYPFDDASAWLHGWTLIWFVWWIAWAPFVGIFIARISRGRTIREFVLGVILAPTALSIVWFAVLGGTGIFEDMQGAGGVGAMVRDNVTVGLFSLLERLPLGTLLTGTTLVLIFVFLVTSVDSATYVLGMLTSRGALEPPTARKFAWGVCLAVLGASLLLTRNLDVLRAVSVLGAIPFTLIMLLQIVALLRALREDESAETPPVPDTSLAEEAP